MAVEPLMGHTQWYMCQVTLNSTFFKPSYAVACILAGGYSGKPISPIIEGRAKNTDVSFLQLGDWQICESKTSYGATKRPFKDKVSTPVMSFKDVSCLPEGRMKWILPTGLRIPDD